MRYWLILSVIRSWIFRFNLSSLIKYIKMSGIHLPSHAVTRIVLSAVKVLTVVFGMGTGVSPSRIDTGQFYLFSSFSLLPQSHWQSNRNATLTFFLERRWSSRTFRYSYLVTTSPQSLDLPSTAASLRLAHRLRAFPTPMVWRAVCTRPGNVFTAACWSAITSDSGFV